MREHGLHRTAEQLRNARRLDVMDPVITPEMEMLTVDNVVFDPERPITPDELVAQFVPKDARKPVPQRLIGLGLLALALGLLAVVWRATPLKDVINLASLVSLAEQLESMPFTPAIAIACFTLAGSLLIPITLLIAVTGIVFGPFYGALYAIAGSTLSAALTYGLGAWIGRETIRELTEDSAGPSG